MRMTEDEQLIYFTEQAMLKVGNKDCPFCKGEGCLSCRGSGKMVHILHQQASEVAQLAYRRNMIWLGLQRED